MRKTVFGVLFFVVIVFLQSATADTSKDKLLQTKEKFPSHNYVYALTKDYIDSVGKISEVSRDDVSDFQTLRFQLGKIIEVLENSTVTMSQYENTSDPFSGMIVKNTLLAFRGLFFSEKAMFGIIQDLNATTNKTEMEKALAEVKKHEKLMEESWKLLSNSSVLLTQLLVAVGSKGRDKPDTLGITAGERRHLLSMLLKYYGSSIKKGVDAKNLKLADMPGALLWEVIGKGGFKLLKK